MVAGTSDIESAVPIDARVLPLLTFLFVLLMLLLFNNCAATSVPLEAAGFPVAFDEN